MPERDLRTTYANRAKRRHNPRSYLDTLIDEDGYYACPLCDKPHANRADLQEHLMSNHRHSLTREGILPLGTRTDYAVANRAPDPKAIADAELSGPLTADPAYRPILKWCPKTHTYIQVGVKRVFVLR